MYKKTKPQINFLDFIQLVSPVANFYSLAGYEYVVKSLFGLLEVQLIKNRKWI